MHLDETRVRTISTLLSLSLPLSVCVCVCVWWTKRNPYIGILCKELYQLLHKVVLIQPLV
jgi:hypothetical protein